MNGELKQRTGWDSWDGTLAPTPIAKIERFSQKSAYRQQVLAEFIACSLPATYGDPVREEGNRSWLKALPMLSDYTKALEASILAIATAKLGRVNENEVLLRESLKFYVTGLWELQKALWDPKSMYKDDTLAACMALIMYEVVECPDKTVMAWAAHMKGCAKIFELKGPDAYTSDFSYELFLSFRVIEVRSFSLLEQCF